MPDMTLDDVCREIDKAYQDAQSGKAEWIHFETRIVNVWPEIRDALEDVTNPDGVVSTLRQRAAVNERKYRIALRERDDALTLLSHAPADAEECADTILLKCMPWSRARGAYVLDVAEAAKVISAHALRASEGVREALEAQRQLWEMAADLIQRGDNPLYVPFMALHDPIGAIDRALTPKEPGDE